MVTGSCYQLTSTSGQKILIDMGMFQGLPSETAWNYTPLQFNPADLSGVILTHAHLDHCGRLPLLTKHGFHGQIYMTPATKDLVELSLYDTAKVATDNPSLALFAKQDVANTISQIKTVDYHLDFNLGSFHVRFSDAGHLLGSAITEIVEASGKKIVFSGDLGNTPQLIINPTESIENSDFVVMESTYGDKTHPSDNPLDVLENEIKAIDQNGGTLLIPCFALERTQDILVLLGDLVRQERVNLNTAFFLDSPMAIKATDIYLNFSSLFNPQALKQFQYHNLFNFPNLEVVEDSKYSNKIKNHPGPKVIISGSGMMTGGRILSHAKFYLPQKNTRLLFVGYQGEETLGRQILEGATQASIDKHSFKIKATISDTQTLSSHADQPRLISWLQKIHGVKKVFLTHGDEEPRRVLSEKIKSDLAISQVFLPKMNEVIDI